MARDTDKIDKLDRKILSILSTNARIPFKDVATQCGVSRAAIHQRVQHLMEKGIITGSGFYVNPGLFYLHLRRSKPRTRQHVQEGCRRTSGDSRNH